MTKATVEVEIDLYDIEDDIRNYVEDNKEDFSYIYDLEDDEKNIDVEFLFHYIADKSIIFELQNSPVYEYGFKNLSEKLVSIINRLSEK